MQKRHVYRHMRSGHDRGISVYSSRKKITSFIIVNQSGRRLEKKTTNMAVVVWRRVWHACEKQFRLGLQKGMEDFPLFLREGLMMFQ